MTGAESEYGIITQNIKDCKPLEQTELAKFDNLEITISKPEKKTEGFFSKTYVTYMVTTLPASYIVRRRYSDFVWLRSTLQNHFPSNVIPPIPKKSRLVGDNFSTQFISKRQRGLEKFMRYLAKDPIIKNSQIFFDFLYIGAESDFNSKKKVYEKVKTMTEVDDFRNKDAKVEIMISGEKENYVENIKDNVNMNITLFKKLNGSFKLLFDEINNVTNRMDEIAGIWEQIYKLSEKYYDDNITCESYKQMSNLFSNWSKILKDQNFLSSDDKLYEGIIYHGLSMKNIFAECQFSEKLLGSYIFRAIKKIVFDPNTTIFEDSIKSNTSNNTNSNPLRFLKELIDDNKSGKKKTSI